MKKTGFTLIELLIVVAIIAILAAIAVPNFLEAQTRAKVSRTVSDMRTLGVGLETYTIDSNRTMTSVCDFPGAPSQLVGPSLVNAELTRLHGNSWVSYRFRRLTTPISYLTSVFPDVFAKDGKCKVVGGGTNLNYDSFDYVDMNIHKDLGRAQASWAQGGITSGGAWRLASCGPDNIQAYGGSSSTAGAVNLYGVDYDASNGTVSTGDICRVGGVAPLPVKPAIDRVHNVYYDPAL